LADLSNKLFLKKMKSPLNFYSGFRSEVANYQDYGKFAGIMKNVRP